ncbi:MAG: hypothetical protein OEL89_00035 [Candidatus Peregrinibacteria bacterium]|nr:hypothetical protein [Candidatus Peregrinibacteria bacterium]
MVLAGKGYYIYYGRSSTFKGGNRLTDKHQAFNPMVNSIDFPESMKYAIEKVTTCNNLFPNIEYDKELGEGTVRFSCHFRDPLVMATFFTYKGVPGTWTGTSDTMTFNFSTLANQDKNMWIQLHCHDQSGNSNHLDIFLDGGEIISYKLIFKAGEPVMEEFEIAFAEINVATETDSTGAYACDIDDGFDDESFNQTGVAEITTITTVAATSITTGDYFKIWLANGTGGWTAYYVWFNKAAGGGDPAPTGFTEIEVAIAADATAATIATAIGAALDAAADNFGTPVVADTLVTVTQQQLGDIKDAVDVNTDFTITTTTQGVTALDGGWSMWDGAYTSKKCVMSVDATITFNNAALADLGVQSLTFDFKAGKTRYRIVSSLAQNGSYLNVQEPWKAIVEGILLKGNSLLAEPSKTIANKTQATIKVQYGTTKYLQFTNTRVENSTSTGEKAGEAQKVSFDLIAGADSVLTYSWTAAETTDPSDHINHTNI